MPVTAALLAVMVGAACAPWFLSAPGRMSRLVAGALPEVDGDVTFRAVRVGWMGPIVLEGIRVVPHDGTAPPLSIARIEADNGLAAIIGSWGDLGRVRVEGLEADVVFDEHHRSNLAGLFRPDPSPSPGRSPRRSPVRMRLEVDDAVVRIAGPWTPEPWTSDPIDVRATLAAAADGAWSEWTVEPGDLLVDARLELCVARNVLAYVAPILEDVTRTSGRFSLRLDGARFPVGQPADGTLAGTLTMHEVVLGPGPLVESLLAWAPTPLPFPGEIRIADGSRVDFRLAERQVVHDGLEFGLPLARAGQRLDVRSSGTVAIDDGALDVVLRLPIPVNLPPDRPVLAALAGKSISIGVRGTLDRPQVVFDGSIGDAAGEFAVDLMERLGTRLDSGTSSADAPQDGSGTAQAVLDLVGGIFDVVKRRAEQRAAEQGDADAAPPRRSRERRRGGRGPAVEP